MNVVNKENARLKVDKTKKCIYNIIEDWNYKAHKKITQGKVADVSGISIRTVKRYWSEFKVYVTELNAIYKTNS
jgi:hypothetical protein